MNQDLTGCETHGTVTLDHFDDQGRCEVFIEDIPVPESVCGD